MPQVTMKANQSSIQRKFDLAEERLKEQLEADLEDKARSIVAWSPVDTGAYVTSHSAVANSTRS